ncbi:MAG: glycoside hydrolase family 25 [Tissierellia bacterium]|jgi:lysozyme|nr:glycoside hydrolase family 25 [Tissierellia bacterium]
MKKKRISKKKSRIKTKRSLFILFVLLIMAFIFLRKEDIEHNNERISTVSFVRGVDVSRYQGDVDFKRLYEQNIRFAFIKFTEGKDYIDPNFQTYWNDSYNWNVKRGAYHFYRFEVSGAEQGKFYIDNMGHLNDEDLPPAIDVEFYGDYVRKPAPKEEVKRELRIMVDMLRDKYNKNPIIYCNRYVYNKYLEEDFEDVDIWYRYIGDGIPQLPGDRQWTFWQFDDSAKLEGYGGPGANEFIDLNYFYGDMEDLNNYGRDEND